MRILYMILYVTLGYTLRVFYPRRKAINNPKSYFGRTIYVSNHPASFMDPLIVASMRRPIVFFMTRADIFTPIAKPFLWACQMLPIYRQLDGGDTRGQNNEVFKRATAVLKGGRNLLIFGEGFTDDTFIRRLKPVKKGAAKIGFQALETIGWKKDIYMSAVGINYGRPNLIGSDILIATSDKFCLNDYRELYEENPNKAITVVTRRIEELLKEQITHVEEIQNAPFHEQMMSLTRRGMNQDSVDRSIPLERRWKYSKRLAGWLNEQNLAENASLQSLKDDCASYFKLLDRMKLKDNYVYWKQTNPSGSRINEILNLILLFPFVLPGLIHFGLPYILVKRFVEKSFRRRVFWGSVKLVVGKISMGLLNIPYIFLFYHFVYPSWWLAIAYYWVSGLFGVAAYWWFKYLKEFKTKGVIKNTDLEKFISKRKQLVKRLEEILPNSL